jgi:hypothetical protein
LLCVEEAGEDLGKLVRRLAGFANAVVVKDNGGQLLTARA